VLHVGLDGVVDGVHNGGLDGVLDGNLLRDPSICSMKEIASTT
jgi:hypothetical protein